MRLAIPLAAMALSLAGCVHLHSVEIFNESDVPITVYTERQYNGDVPSVRRERVVRAGKRKEVRMSDLPRNEIVIAAAGCRMLYGSATHRAAEAGHNFLYVQVEPDFSIHLLEYDPFGDGPVVDRFRDGELPGFPMIPKKTCG